MDFQQTHRFPAEQPVAAAKLSGAYKHNRIGHAYLFDGEKGVGKKDAALYFAQLLLCEHPSDNVPCETCHACRRVLSGNHPNILTVEPDGQDIKKDQMARLLEAMTKKAYEQGRRIYIIEQAHRLNTAAANALLKFLEEPDGDVTAILLTDAYHMILPTIQSRCQRLSFLPPRREQVVERLKAEGISPSLAATVTCLTADAARAAELASEEQFVTLRKTVVKLVQAIDQHVTEALMLIQTEWGPFLKEKEDAEMGLDLLLYMYRDIVAKKAGMTALPAYPDLEEFTSALAMKMTYDQLASNLESILQAKKQLHRNMHRTLLLEQLVLSMQEGLSVV
ncbi:DNA polymerase III subunit delta' [Sporosarcina sp. NCCP-2716]|uniref:DNA polymerase III subunit delta' n=1 Tax=Sporosarcina sp. NCCP-2716 TaxID=2943679 RepID=UPI00203F8D53|nr:DNA polymerase III subunit delta' [Sporosarcina sp. NCCP-2716]GKV70402.1 DNA polymerase III subunit delta' [Sporosarcina sp. NCCP-2716]